MVLRSLPFPEACFLVYVPWGWLWRQHWRNCRISKTKTKSCLTAKILF